MYIYIYIYICILSAGNNSVGVLFGFCLGTQQTHNLETKLRQQYEKLYTAVKKTRKINI